MNNRPTPKSAGFIRRLIAFGSAAAVLLSVFIFRLYQFQIVEGESYLENAMQTVSYSFPVYAARGDIVDRNGRVIATSETTQNIVLNKLFLPDGDLNDTLLAVVKILEANGEGWIDDTPLTTTAPYEFTGQNDDGTDGKDANAMKTAFGKQGYATAAQVVEAAIQQFGLAEYTPAEQRTLLGIRYMMLQAGYSGSVPYTLAENVGEVTRAVIAENTMGITGVELHDVSTRVYPEGAAMPHVLGIVGLISEEAWQQDNYALRAAGYAKDDTIGVFGLEQAFESNLRGTDGSMEIVRRADGTVESTEIVDEPAPGETLVLTVDLDFQYQLQDLLEEFILGLQDNAENAGGNANAGAAVVLDVNTGGVLAYANYPSYDINDYYSGYSELSTDEATPLVNRAFMGSYRPGSSFKPVVALAGLMSGEINAASTVRCTGTYTYYSGYSPGCLGTHGNISVRAALQHSCNVFFYDVGRRVGYEEYNTVAEALGLGVATGVEVAEYAGRLSSPETSAALGMEWSPADVTQAAIGQLNTAVSPVQLATYAATLANGGTRYRTHLVGSIQNQLTGEAVESFDAEVVSQLLDDESFSLVEEGMVLAAQQGIYREYLAEVQGTTIATKTGSPQTSATTTNSVIIAYGPVEGAEIAVAVVIENGSNGYRSAPLVEQIFEAYYGL